MSVAAFHVGLKHKVQELENLFQGSDIYDGDYNATELRKLLIKREIPEAIDEDELYKIAESVLDLARDGLEERGFGEEIFLNALYENIEDRTNPGKRILDDLDEGRDLEEIIKEYGALD